MEPELKKNQIPSFVKVVDGPFVPHFNVQLYHLKGKKRYGESSGSLHRGISIPVVFEANGAERLENIRCIKIKADDDLHLINFEEAAAETLELAEGGFQDILSHNKRSALKNSVGSFARSVIKAFKS